MNAIDTLKNYSHELSDLHSIMALLQWDQEVMLPRRASEDRAGQLATLSAIIHRKEVAPELRQLLESASEVGDDLSEIDRALIRVMQRSYEQNTKLPEEFVTEFTRLTSRSLNVWIEARQKSDYSLFEPLLAKVVEMSRTQAEYLGYPEKPYDALLDIYEEGLKTEQVKKLFSELREPLAQLVKDCRKSFEAKELLFDFDQASQVAFAEQALAKIGYDFERGRQDVSTHPFSTAIGHHDRRVTNRYNPNSIEFIFSALHEGGHALYEQGISDVLSNTALDTGVSLGIHESQSRLWENIIGRSLPFWQHFYPELQKSFPLKFEAVQVEDFVRHINQVEPGLIRVEADEVCYNLHVLIRFELEEAIMDGTIQVGDLPSLWNEKYKKYLGVDVPSDALGVLQDIHWAHGSLGYFPTYTLGNLAAAQIWHKYRELEPEHERVIAAGELGRIRDWLTENIYSHGSVYPPDELLLKVTGEPLQTQYLLDYLKDKYLQA